MDLKKQFHKILIFKGFLFFLIVIWGGYNQIVASSINNDFSLLDIGGLGFLIFSICYYQVPNNNPHQFQRNLLVFPQ